MLLNEVIIPHRLTLTFIIFEKCVYLSLHVLTYFSISKGIYTCFDILYTTTELQSFTKYLRQTLVFMLNSALQEKFSFCFSGDFY